MIAPPVRVGREWLTLREPADAAARARELAEHLARSRPARGRWVIHDLGGGTGAMGRWLAPLLPGPQHWVVHDLDPDLLQAAGDRPPGPAADGSPVTLETRHSDIARLGPADLAGANLITASALLDLLTEEELTGVIGACCGPRCPILLTVSVTGSVELSPADPLDHCVAAAFNAHQGRMTERGRLLGPNAAALAVEQFARLGRKVFARPSPWRLERSQVGLVSEWFIGWVGAACEQEPGLTSESEAYARQRLTQAALGELAVTVDHIDLLVLLPLRAAYPNATGGAVR